MYEILFSKFVTREIYLLLHAQKGTVCQQEADINNTIKQYYQYPCLEFSYVDMIHVRLNYSIWNSK